VSLSERGQCCEVEDDDMSPIEALATIELSTELDAAWTAMGEPDVEGDEWISFVSLFSAIRMPAILEGLEEDNGTAD